MSDKPDDTYDDDLAVEEAKPKLKRPQLYKVILIKGPPFDFETETLEFSRTIKTATIEHKYTKVAL